MMVRIEKPLADSLQEAFVFFPYVKIEIMKNYSIFIIYSRWS